MTTTERRNRQVLGRHLAFSVFCAMGTVVAPFTPPSFFSHHHAFRSFRRSTITPLRTAVGGDDGVSKALNLLQTGMNIYKEIESRNVTNEVDDQDRVKNNANSTRVVEDSGQNTTALPLKNILQDQVDAFNARAKRTRIILLRKLVAWAYDVCKATKEDGRIDQSALYAGTLLVHLHLSKYVGVAACLPPTRDVVDTLFELADADNSGFLNQEEFTKAVLVACTPITIRVVIYWTLLAVLPFVVSRTMGGITRLISNQIEHLPSRLLRRTFSVVEWTVQHVFSLFLFSFVLPYLFNKVDKAARKAARKKCAPDQSTLWWLQPKRTSGYLQRVGNSLYSLQDSIFGKSSSKKKKSKDEDIEDEKK